MTLQAPAAPPTDLDDVGPKLAEICEAAAALILPLWRSGLEVMSKADESPVTEADQRGEALILQALARAFPDIPVIAEEDSAAGGVPTEAAARFFLVDPLDGTKAFVRGDPNFTVNIGLVEGGRVRAGAVVAPPTGEAWFTTPSGTRKRLLGGGSEAVRVRPPPAGEVLGLISHTAKPETVEALKEKFGFQRAEAMDSSIKLCRIAEGAADIYPRYGPTMEWDIAAGHAVLINAGGVLAGLEGEPFLYAKSDKGFRNPGFIARGG